MRQRFLAVRSKAAFIGIGGGYLILIISIVAPLTFPDGETPGLGWGLFIPFLFVLFFLYVLTASLFKMFLIYTVSNEGITIYSPPFHSRLLPFGQILSVTLLDENESRKLIEASILEQNSYGESADLAGYVRMLRKRSPLFRYFTIAPSARVSTTGAGENITSLKVHSTGQIVVIKMKDYREYYLTPERADAFKLTVERMLTK